MVGITFQMCQSVFFCLAMYLPSQIITLVLETTGNIQMSAVCVTWCDCVSHCVCGMVCVCGYQPLVHSSICLCYISRPYTRLKALYVCTLSLLCADGISRTDVIHSTGIYGLFLMLRV